MITYAIHQWKDENVKKVCSNKITIQEFFEKCSPDMPEDAREELFYHYFHDYFHDHEYRIDPAWMLEQLRRPDSDERMMAFYESIYDAITTDTEDWQRKGYDIAKALVENNATALLIALCGWGAESLAKRVMMTRGIAQYQDAEIECALKVDWSDGVRTTTPCLLDREEHMIFDFNYDIFVREDAPTATIQNIFVRFAPFDDGNEYDFQCVSQAQRDAADDNEIFWYPPEDSVE